MHETFEHTADLGLRVRSPDLEALFREAAEGLFSMMVEGDPIRPGDRPLEFRIDGERRDYLLFDWLNELLYAFDTQRLVLGQFRVRVGEHGLEARARGRPLRPGSDRLLHEVKAITYHRLKVERDGDGWLAEVIVDI
jgi:SHS2 domain-containing protein